MSKTFKTIIVWIIPLLFAALFLSYRLVEVPPALTVDEAAFGYNAILLARNGHDENGKLLPFFVNSIKGTDWRQPVTQYYTAIFFKIFGASTFKLRFTSVILALLSSVLIFKLVSVLLNKRWAFVASILILVTPIIFMQSHMALDNLMPVPFAILWLLFLFLYGKERKLKYLFWAGVSLGINFYSYKAMRGVVPCWIVLSALYLSYKDLLNKKITKRLVKELLVFTVGILPFFIIIPYLKVTYPGAVFAGYRPHGIAWDDFFYTYLANLDFSFLFLKGDSTVYHSTGKHGMLLLSTLPLFTVGCYKSIREGKFWRFVLAVFFLTPFVFSFAGSFYRASRLLSLVPAFILLTTLGSKYVFRFNKIFFLIIIFAIIINFSNFVNYYWFTYPKFVRGDFSQTREESYKVFSEEAKKRNLSPYIDQDLYNSDGEIAHFFESMFFAEGTTKLKSDEDLPKGGILMTYREDIPGLTKIHIPTPNYYLHIKNEVK